MARYPGYAAYPRMGRGVITAATTDKTGATTTQIKDALTGAASGTKIEEVRFVFDGNPGDCTLLVFVYNGTDYRLYDDIDIGDQAASSATVVGFTYPRQYNNLYLPDANHKIAGAVTAITSGNCNFWAAGGDF